MLEVRILGPLEVHFHGRQCHIKSSTHRLLLAVLASEHPDAVELYRLVDAVWDVPPRTAEKSLLSHVSRLRRRLGAEAIERVGDGYRLRASVDADEFERLLDTDAADLARLDRALGLWRGRPFGGLGNHRFLLAVRERLEARHTEARLCRARLLLRDEQLAQAIALLDTIVAGDPLHEGTWVALVDALRRSGRVADALRAAQRARSALGEVGLEPSRPLVEAEAAALEESRVPPPGDAPAAREGQPPPHPMSSLRGRDRELEDVARLLAESRCVTLVGPGGVGKTRLAIEVVGRDVPYPDRWFCDLATVAEPNDVPAAVARAIGASLTGSIEQRLIDYATGRSGLLLLDNCEHLVEATASLLADWLPRCPAVAVLVTSRTRLGIEGERIYEVTPLDDRTAATLFRERASAVGVSTTAVHGDLIADICRRLDGLPLAIEMAAARARAIALPELAGRLDRRFDLLRDDRRPVRHRTLSELVTWSYETLTPDQKRAFVLLAIFAGEFDLPAAEAVLGSCLGQGDRVASLLAALRERSLLAASPSAPTRYRMLDTIHAEAAERLTSGDAADEAASAHIAHYLERARAIDHGLKGPDEARWAARADTDLPNLRAAHRSAIKRGLMGPALAIPAALYHFVYRGLRSDIASWAHESIQLASGTNHPDLPAAYAVAALGKAQADHLDEAESLAREALRLSDGDPPGRFAQLVLANVCIYRGLLDESRDHAEAARAVAASVDDSYTASVGAVVRAIASTFAGRHRDAERALAESRRQAERLGSPTLIAYTHYVEGELRIESDPASALDSFESAIATMARGAGARALGVALLSATSVRARHGDPYVALPQYAATIRHWLDLGDWMHVWTTLRNLAVLLARIGEYQGAAQLLGATSDRAGGAYGAEADRLDQTSRLLRTQLGANRYERAVDEGRRLPADEIVRLAFEHIANAS